MATSAGVTALHLTGDLGFFAGGMDVQSLIGTFIKSVERDATTGTVTFTYQQTDGTEDTLEITEANRGFHFTTATWEPNVSRLSLTPPAAQTIGVGDLVAFLAPTGISTTETDTVVVRVGTSGSGQDLHDIDEDNVPVSSLQSGLYHLLLRVTGDWILLTPDITNTGGAGSWDDLTGKQAARPSRTDLVAGTSDTAALWAPSDISDAIDVHDSSLIGPFHFRINESATQTDSQAAHFLGGIYRNISGRPLRILEAFIPVHPGGGGTVGYNMYVWRLDRISATSYLTPTTDAGNVENLRLTSGGSNIEFDVPAGQESELHGYSPQTVVIEPNDYFAVAVDRVINGTNANTIVASGADVDEDFDNAIEYVAKASFAATFSVNRGEELYHNSSFAEQMRLVFEFTDGGVLPPIHGIQNEMVPEGMDRLPFSDESASGTPNAYIEWADAVNLIRNVSVYERSRPQATADNLHDVVISAVDRSGDICLNVPHRTTESTGTWAAITPGTNIEYARVRSDATPVQSRFLYEYFTDDFWFGADVGGGQVEWVQDDADDALAAFLTTGIDSVQWLHHHATDDEALAALPTLPATHEAFYWNTADLEIRKLTSSTFVPAGSPGTSAHYVWVRLFGEGAIDPSGGGTSGGDTPSVVLFEGPDTPATYVPNVAARPNFRALVLSRAPMADRSLQIEIEANTNTNTTANPTPAGATTIYTSDHIETNHLAGANALPVLAGAQLTTFSVSGNQGPSVGNTTGSKIARGNENDANDFGHSNIWVGHGENADGDFVLYVAHSHWGSMPAHVIRVRERSFGGGTSQQAGGGAITERQIVSTPFEPTRSSSVGIGSANNWTFSLVTLDPVLIADVDTFSLGVRVGGREAFPITLDRRAVLEMGHHPGVGWIWHGSEYDGASQVPCLMVSGKHNSEGQYRHSIQPIRQQIGYSLSNSDVTYLLFVFFDYDATLENIIGMDVAAISSQTVEIDWASLFFTGEEA